jgi:hypothetical protein
MRQRSFFVNFDIHRTNSLANVTAFTTAFFFVNDNSYRREIGEKGEESSNRACKFTKNSFG